MIELNEKTRLDLKFSNAWAILISVAVGTASFLAIYFKIMNRLDAIDMQLSYLVKQNDEYFNRNHEVQERMGYLEIFSVKVAQKLDINYELK